MGRMPEFIAEVSVIRGQDSISPSKAQAGDYYQVAVSEVLREADGKYHGVLRGSAYTLYPNVSAAPAIDHDFEDRFDTESPTDLPSGKSVPLRRTGILFWARHVAELPGDQHLSVIYNPFAFRGHRVKIVQ